MKKAGFLLSLIMLSLLISSCSAYSEDKTENTQDNNAVAEDNYDVMDEGPVAGGILKLFSTTPDTLNPILTNNAYVQDYLGLLFDGMVALDKEQKPMPALADRWEVSPDGLIWTFHIRENAVWHNNMPVTADDVKFTMDTIQNSKINSVYKKNIKDVSLFTAVDRNNFKIFLSKPYSFTPELMTFPIIPRYYYSQDDITVLNSEINMHPVGTGPYKLAAGNEAGMLKLVKNEKWWGLKNSANKENEGLPYINEINVKIYKSGKEEINALQTNDVDAVYIHEPDFGKYGGRQDITLRKYLSKNFDFIAINMGNTILSDNIVRQAIAYGIDRMKIVNEVLEGEAMAAEMPVMPNTWLYDTEIISRGYDKYKAKDLLLQDGWKEEEGTLYKSLKGKKRYLNLELTVNDYNIQRYRIAEEIARQLKEIGINLTLKKIKWEDETKLLNSRKFDMALLGWRVTSVPDVSFAYSSLEAAGGMNVSGYKNTTVDTYLEQINKENDQGRKKALFSAMKEIIMNDMPYIGLCFYNNGALFTKRVKGEIDPRIWNKYYGIEKWYIVKGFQGQ